LETLLDAFSSLLLGFCKQYRAAGPQVLRICL